MKSKYKYTRRNIQDEKVDIIGILLVFLLNTLLYFLNIFSLLKKRLVNDILLHIYYCIFEIELI